jgi:predicted amidophosphoribosyltransferase
LQNAAETDSELRALERALGNGEPLRELRVVGIGGACAKCGTVHGSGDQFCATCGEPLAKTPAPATEPSSGQDPAAPPDEPDIPRTPQ